MEETIKVCVRFRPVNSREQTHSLPRRKHRVSDSRKPSPSLRKEKEKDKAQDDGSEFDESDDLIPWEWDRTSVTAKFPVTRGERSRQERSGNGASHSKEFLYDRVFSPDESTETVYDEIMQDLVVSAMEGKHCAAFAFGQTSTGKTYTMQGTSEFPGVIPRAVHDVFSYINQASDREFLLRVAYMEVYNESINDLFEPQSTNLKVFEDPQRGPMIQGLEEKIVVTPEQVFALISAGEAQRHIGSTDYNKQSSRSHTIFRIVIESREKGREGELRSKVRPARVATLNLVDLAGSESAQSIQSKTRRQEGSHINKSLLTLTHVIYKLSEQRGKDVMTHIPYRDSKLTRILQKALQGNSRVSIVCTATPWTGAKEETLNTLRFAMRAKRVKRAVQVNEVLDERALLLKYKQEIAVLRQKLAEAELKSQQQLQFQREQQLQAHHQVPGTKEKEEDDEGDEGNGEDALAKKSGEKKNSQLREQIDQAIRNLNRLILNSGMQEFIPGPSSTDDDDKSDDQLEEQGEFEQGGEDEQATELKSHPSRAPTTPIRASLKQYLEDTSTPFFRKLSSVDHDLDKYDKLFFSAGRRLSRSASYSEAMSSSPSKVQEESILDMNQPPHSRTRRNSADSCASPSPLKKEKKKTKPKEDVVQRNLLEDFQQQTATEPPRVPPLSSSSSARNSITAELRSIREHLSNLLVEHDRELHVDSRGSVSTALKDQQELSQSSARSPDYVRSLELRVQELEKQVLKYDVEQSVSRADRSFLENLLAEKDKTIEEWGDVIRDIEVKQEQLEEENERLRILVARYERQLKNND